VTNVARHAGVPAAEINFARPVPGVLRVEIRDRGHTPGGWRPGAGLESMRERVEQIGGTFSITTDPAGSIITADMPLHAPPVTP
jgi:signal transduction histidine kinase